MGGQPKEHGGARAAPDRLASVTRGTWGRLSSTASPFFLPGGALTTHEIPEDARRLVAQRIRSTTELELLLLVHQLPEQGWTDRDVAQALRDDADHAARILFDLMARGLLRLVKSAPLTYRYGPSSPEIARAVEAVVAAHAAAPDAVRALIRRPASASLRQFADAFRLRHDKEDAW
jgi:hypothetical protein